MRAVTDDVPSEHAQSPPACSSLRVADRATQGRPWAVSFSGTATVRMVVIRAPETVPAALFAVQVGAFRDFANADKTRADMARFGLAQVVQRPENPGVWRVMVGSETTMEGANALLSRISQETEIKAFVVRLN